MPGHIDSAEGWVDRLDANAYGVRLLTLSRACELAAEGSCSGWYIAPFAAKWTAGRMARSGERYHVISDGEPIRFENMAEAFQFFAGILHLTAAPKLDLNFPAALKDPEWRGGGVRAA